MANERKPWLDSSGNPLSEEKIHEVSKSWPLETWRRYSESLEAPLRETIPEDEHLIENLAVGYGEICKDASEAEDEGRFSSLAAQLRVCMRSLSIRQERVVHDIFWQDKSQEEVARELKISRSAVRNYRDQALKKLGVLFIQNALALKVWKRKYQSACPPGSAEKYIGRGKNSQTDQERI